MIGPHSLVGRANPDKDTSRPAVSRCASCRFLSREQPSSGHELARPSSGVCQNIACAMFAKRPTLVITCPGYRAVQVTP